MIWSSPCRYHIWEKLQKYVIANFAENVNYDNKAFADLWRNFARRSVKEMQ